jgi:hypothetical protein
MVIYIWPTGSWKYSWEVGKTTTDGAKAVDLDKWYTYNLTELEVLACLEALEE